MLRLLMSTTLLLGLIATFEAYATSDIQNIADSLNVDLTPSEIKRIEKIADHFKTLDKGMVARNIIQQLKISKSDQSFNTLQEIQDNLKERVRLKMREGMDFTSAIEEVRVESVSEMENFPPFLKRSLLHFSEVYLSNLEAKRNERYSNDPEAGEGLFEELEQANGKKNLAWKELFDSTKDNQFNDKDDPVFGGVNANGVRFPAFPRRMLNRDVTTTGKESFSAQVKVSFLGAELAAGPEISFERRFVINAKLIAHGNEPIVAGNSDLGVGVLNHSEGRRIVFFCTATAQATHKLSGSAGLTVFGTGASVERGYWEGISVVQTSDLAYVPFANKEGRRTTLKDIESYCTKTFYNKVKNSLKSELKLASSELVYSHNQTQCVKDSHCLKWHRSRLGIIQPWTVARCQSTKISGDPVFLCKLKGKRGNACSVYNSKGERLTAGYFEYPCDKGLKCTVTQEGGWFTNWSIHSPWKAECR